MGQAGGAHSGTSIQTSLLQQGPPRAHGPGLHPNGSEISPRRETPHLLWATHSSAWSLQSEVLPNVQMELPVHQTLPHVLVAGTAEQSLALSS